MLAAFLITMAKQMAETTKKRKYVFELMVSDPLVCHIEDGRAKQFTLWCLGVTEQARGRNQDSVPLRIRHQPVTCISQLGSSKILFPGDSPCWCVAKAPIAL